MSDGKRELTDEEVMEVFDNAPIQFGLSAQGHVPTIRAMLRDGKPWAVIAHRIGWMEDTARAWYLQSLIDELGSWASAAQDDDGCCEELKDLLARVLEAGR
jgi:hypothetical protein